jgi:putative acetyltransferase
MLRRFATRGHSLLHRAARRNPFARLRSGPPATIRPYRYDDLDSVLHIWRAANAVAHPFLGEDFLRAEHDNVRDIYLPAAETWVAEAEGHVVGFISLLGHQVGGLFLAPAWHGRRIGKALMDTAVAERGTLELDVFAANVIGRRFYDRYGFVDADYYIHTPTGQRVLRLTLPAA